MELQYKKAEPIKILPCKYIWVPAFRSEERRVGKSVDLGGRRIIKKKKEKKVATWLVRT